jgi:hypothetical protein
MCAIQDKAQITMLAMWLVEIFLTQMDQLEEAGDKESFQALQQELRSFLMEPKVKVCRGTSCCQSVGWPACWA